MKTNEMKTSEGKDSDVRTGVPTDRENEETKRSEGKGSDVRTGVCLCGDVKIEIPKAPPLFIDACHCSRCQRSSGAPFSFNVCYPVDEVKVHGKVKGYASSENMTRHWCDKCGSRTHIYQSGLAYIAVALFNKGGIKGLPKDMQAPKFHVFYGDRILNFKDGVVKFVTLPKEAGGNGETVPKDES
ncbi:hypothetical protein AAMO2058_000582100 [Amorphochlora amoebiformis]